MKQSNGEVLMYRYLVATLFVPTTCFALQHGTPASLQLEPFWIAAMTAIVIAQLTAVHLRDQWEARPEEVFSKRSK